MDDDDIRTEAAWSAASNTDRIMFAMLTNHDRLDMERMPAVSMNDIQESRIEEINTPPRLSPVVEETEKFAHDADEQNELLHELHKHFGHVRSPSPPQSPPPMRAPSYPAPNSPARDQTEHNPGEARPATANEEHVASERPSYNAFVSDMSKQEEDGESKRSVLMDLRRLQMQGVTLSKEWSMSDAYDDMNLEMRRLTLALDEQNNVNMMRDGLKLAITGIELLNNKLGLLDLEGWSSEVNRDINKHDVNLSRLYRKYWRRGTSHSPETEILLALGGSLGMHHMKRTMAKQLLSRTSASGSTASRVPQGSQVDDESDYSTDDEGPP